MRLCCTIGDSGAGDGPCESPPLRASDGGGGCTARIGSRQPAWLLAGFSVSLSGINDKYDNHMILIRHDKPRASAAIQQVSRLQATSRLRTRLDYLSRASTHPHEMDQTTTQKIMGQPSPRASTDLEADDRASNPLLHESKGPEVLIDFDNGDDPYHPIN